MSHFRFLCTRNSSWSRHFGRIQPCLQTDKQPSIIICCLSCRSVCLATQVSLWWHGDRLQQAQAKQAVLGIAGYWVKRLPRRAYSCCDVVRQVQYRDSSWDRIWIWFPLPGKRVHNSCGISTVTSDSGALCLYMLNSPAEGRRNIVHFAIKAQVTRPGNEKSERCHPDSKTPPIWITIGRDWWFSGPWMWLSQV